jgi:hypothetical protein
MPNTTKTTLAQTANSSSPGKPAPTIVANPVEATRQAPSSGRASVYRVKIRMYRQGIGDSFLLSFPQGEQTRHLLIDCGVLVGTPDGTAWIQNIAKDVAKETNSKLDAVVGTHPHWDHLSGFLDANDQFKAIAIEEVWMAWTENPNDPAGRAQKSRAAAQLAALQLALAPLAASSELGVRDQGSAIADLLAFYGPPDNAAGLGAAASGKTQQAVDALRGLGKVIKYWNPGDVITPAWLPNVRIYVLGPPRDEMLLGKMLSSRVGDLYSLGIDSGFAAALLSSTSAVLADPAAQGVIDALRPFDPSFLFSPEEAAKEAVLGSITALYTSPDGSWRTIDSQWLLAAEALALQLDNAINNLSLVLAIEFIDTRDVLFFPADAQVGNWLSWQALKWNVKDAAGNDVSVTSKDLLARTRFYKVGHHGSHNATLKEGGLEDMVHPGLVAAIPVNESFAKGTKHWEMPAAALYSRLQAKTEGRLFRSDGIGPLASTGTPQSSGTDWEAYQSSVAVDDGTPSLYVEYLFK